MQGFQTVPGLLDIVEKVGLASVSASPGTRAAACELVLEALVAERRISRSEAGGYQRSRHEGPGKQGLQGFDPFNS